MTVKVSTKDFPAAKAKGTVIRLHSWLYTLIYPAVLGTMFVGAIFAIPDIGDPRLPLENFAFIIYFIAYFSTQHVENSLDDRTYDYYQFGTDVVEIGLLLVLFLMLGVRQLDLNLCTIGIDRLFWSRVFYGLTAIVFSLPLIARYGEYKSLWPTVFRARLSFLSGVAIVASLFGMVSLIRWWPLILMAIPLILYGTRFFLFRESALTKYDDTKCTTRYAAYLDKKAKIEAQ